MKAQPVPSNYPRMNAVIAARDAKVAIDYYIKVFGARERLRLTEPSGKVGYAELEFGNNGFLMLSDRYEGWNLTPDDVGGKTTVVLHIYVEDVDATMARGVAEGGTQIMAPANQFYGDRSGRLRDPFGHVWLVSTHIEDVSEEEMKRRFAAMPAS